MQSFKTRIAFHIGQHIKFLITMKYFTNKKRNKVRTKMQVKQHAGIKRRFLNIVNDTQIKLFLTKCSYKFNPDDLQVLYKLV